MVEILRKLAIELLKGKAPPEKGTDLVFFIDEVRITISLSRRDVERLRLLK